MTDQRAASPKVRLMTLGDDMSPGSSRWRHWTDRRLVTSPRAKRWRAGAFLASDDSSCMVGQAIYPMVVE